MTTLPALPQIDETLLASTRYLHALTVLDDQSVRRPSVLPGWSRAHVVAHLSRNADAFSRVLGQVASGEAASMYASDDGRDRDIEETVRTCDLHRLVEDAIASVARLTNAFWAGTSGLDASYARLPGGPTFPLTTVGPRRRAEVEIHHADLDLGYAPADWPADFSTSLVEQRRAEMAALLRGCPSMVLGSTDVAGLWRFGDGQGPEIHGAVGDLAYWLVGRGDGRGLTCSSGELPALGGWR